MRSIQWVHNKKWRKANKQWSLRVFMLTHTHTRGLCTPCQVQLCFHRGTAGPERGYFRLQRPDWIKAGLIPVEFVSFFQATLNPNQIIQPAPCCHYHNHSWYCSSYSLSRVDMCMCIALSFPLLQFVSVFLPHSKTTWSICPPSANLLFLSSCDWWEQS